MRNVVQSMMRTTKSDSVDTYITISNDIILFAVVFMILSVPDIMNDVCV